MAIPGWGGAVAIVLSWVDKLIPSKKAAVVDQLRSLNAKYEKALKAGKDTEAATLRKQMEELRKKAEVCDGEI